MQRLEIAFHAHVQRLQLFLIRGRELGPLLSLCKPLCALQSDPTPAAEFQLLAATSTSTPRHAPSDIMCQSHQLPENLEQDFLPFPLALGLCLPTWKRELIDSCNKHPLKIGDCL